MDHIFGVSDTIDFGSKPRTPVRKPVSREPSPLPKTPPSPSPVRSDGAPQLQPLRPQDSLQSLIGSMKPTFLPKDENDTLLRALIFSDPNVVDPFFLLHRDETTVLVGTGFSTLEKAGKLYTTFPDQRLMSSQKTYIRAWILVDEHIAIEPFVSLLPLLDFPPLYATRGVIAKFRNNIKDTSFLEKCRFFEIFSETTPVRNIGGIEFGVTNFPEGPTLAMRVGKQYFGFPQRLADQASTYEGAVPFQKTKEGWLLGNDPVQTGEILILNDTTLKKHPLKFSFDTFYFDGQSVGVVAGYTLADRLALSEAGVLIFTLQEDTRARTISGHIFIDSRGFVHSHETMRIHKEILKAIRINYENIVADQPTIDRGELAQSLKKEIAKYCFVLTGRAPMVMPIII